MTESTPEAVFSPGRLRAWADVRDIDPAVLAEAAGTSTTYVRACQSGHPSATPPPATVAAWASALGCTMADLHSHTPYQTAEYWKAASRAMGPLRQEDAQAIADVLDRNARRRAKHEH